MIIKAFQPNFSKLCDIHYEDFWPTKEKVSDSLQEQWLDLIMK